MTHLHGGPKGPMTAKQRYAFRYWRRGLRKAGFHLDRLALRNGIQYAISGPCLPDPIITLRPGKWLEHIRGNK